MSNAGSSAASSSTVTLYSADQQAPHQVSRARLKSLGGHFQEGPQGTIQLPNTSESVVENFVWWLSRGSAPRPATALTDWSGMTTAMGTQMIAQQQQLAVHLWAFADQHDLDTLARGAIRHLFIWLARGVPKVDLVQEAFNLSEPGCKLRRLLVWKAADGNNESYEGYTLAEKQILVEIQGFLAELDVAQQESARLGTAGVNNQGCGFEMENEPILLNRIAQNQS